MSCMIDLFSETILFDRYNIIVNSKIYTWLKLVMSPKMCSSFEILSQR
jgi:hypothetical protein